MNAYNKIDNKLRSLYGYRDTLTFSDLIRKTAAVNYIVRKYEDDLIDYARLRNAIVHKRSKGDEVIAEPHKSTVDIMESIAKLISTPPGAFKFARSSVITFPHDTRLKEIVASMGKYGYSNIPIMKDGAILGVINNKQIIEELGKSLLNKKTADSFIYNTYAGDILANDGKHFTLLKKNASIEQVLNLFRNNQKLRAVIFTDTGTNLGRPLGIITSGDLLELNAELDKF